MKPLRTKLLLSVLNKHQSRLVKMDVASARLYFDKISKSRIKPRVRSVHDGVANGVPVRIYKNSKLQKSTLIYMHGGGWALGSISSHDVVARLLCRTTNCSVVSIGYRLAPENPYPAQVEDAIKVITWLQQQSRGLGKDYYLVGDSAGAHIALYAALEAKKDNLVAAQGLILMYPAFDPELSSDSAHSMASGHFVYRNDMKNFWSMYLLDRKPDWPLTDKQLQSLPPVLIQALQYDLLRDEAVQLGDRLHKLNPQSKSVVYPGAVHGILQIFHIFSGRNRLLKDIQDFIKNRTKPE